MVDNFLGNKIKQIRLDMGLTLEAFGKKFNTSKGNVLGWEKGKNSPNKERLKAIADYAGISVGELTGVAQKLDYDSIQKQLAELRQEIASTKQPATLPPAHKTTKKAIRINVYGSIPAGIPIEAVEDVEDWEEIPAEMAAGGKEFIALKVKGDSMWPQYLEDDVVIIQLQPDCESGDDCAVYVNGYDVTLKTVKKADGQITLKPINPSYPPKTYKHPGEIKILGKVVELRRKI